MYEGIPDSYNNIWIKSMNNIKIWGVFVRTWHGRKQRHVIYSSSFFFLKRKIVIIYSSMHNTLDLIMISITILDEGY